MPTQTYLKLPKEKQDIIKNAAKEEFSNHLLSEASINRIIKNIGMPRGTFYLYFKSKEELYFYILEEYAEKGFQKLKETLQTNHGDFLKSIEIYVKQTMQSINQNKQKNFFKNSILNMNYHVEHNIIHKPPPQHNVNLILPYINREKLNIEKEEDLKEIFHIIIPITMHAIACAIINEKETDKIMMHYHKQLNLLKEGLERK